MPNMAEKDFDALFTPTMSADEFDGLFGVAPKKPVATAAPKPPRPKPSGADFASTILQDSSAPAVLRTASDAAAEIVTHPIATTGAVVKAVPKVVEAAGMSALKAVITPRSRANETLAGELIRRSEERGRKYAEAAPKDRPFAKALAENIPSLGFSAVAMGAGLGAGVGTAIATTPAGGGVGNIALGTAAGMEASGLAAFQMAKNDIMTTYLDAENDASIAAGKGQLTPQREAQLREEFANKAVRYGLWEAIPEAIGNVAGFKIFTAPLKRMVGSAVASRMEKGIAGKAAGWIVKGGAATLPEIATETVTQMGQQRQTAGTVLAPDEKPRSFTSLEDWGKSAKEVAAQTVFTVALMGGASAVGKKAYSYRTAPVKQAADMVAAAEDFAKNPDALQTLPTEALAGLLAESDTLAAKFPKAKGVVEPLARVKEVFAAELERRGKEADQAVAPEVVPEPAIPKPAKSKVGDALARKKAPKEPVPEPVPAPPIPDIAAEGLDASRQKFIDGLVGSLGSVEAVDSEFNQDTPRDRYARAKAREIFVPPTVPETPQPAAVSEEIAPETVPADVLEEEVPITDEAPAYDAEAARRIAEQVSGVAAKPMDRAAKVMRDNVTEAGSYDEVDKRYPVLDSPKSKAGKQQIKDREAALKLAEQIHGKPTVKESLTTAEDSTVVEAPTIRQSLIVQPETTPNEEANRETPPEAVLNEGYLGRDMAYYASREAEEQKAKELAAYVALPPEQLQAKRDSLVEQEAALIAQREAISGKTKEAKKQRQALLMQIGHVGDLRRAADAKAKILELQPQEVSRQASVSEPKPAPTPAPIPISDRKYPTTVDNNGDTIVDVQPTFAHSDLKDKVGEIVSAVDEAIQYAKTPDEFILKQRLKKDRETYVENFKEFGKITFSDGKRAYTVSNDTYSLGKLKKDLERANRIRRGIKFNVIPRPGVAEDVAPSSPAGMTSDAVTATINPAMDKWPNMPFNGVIVVGSIDELPGKYGDAARATEKKSGGVVRGFFNPESQTIFLVANNIASEKDAIEVLIHEAIGHYGLRGALGNQLDAFLNDLARVKSAEVKAHAAKVGLDFNDPSQRLTAAEEWMATQIQKGTLAKGWMQRLGEVIRKIIRGMGIKLTLNDNDIAAIARKAYEFVEKGKAESVAGREAYDVAAKTDSPNFKRWFGNSKVVDKDGKPLVVYHGTDANVEAYNNDKLGSKTGNPLGFLGHFFTPSPQVAESFAKDNRASIFKIGESFSPGANISPNYLAIKNPFIMTAEEFRNKLPVAETYTDENGFMKSPEAIIDFKENLIKQGYDGIRIVADQQAGMAHPGLEEFAYDNWVAFSPTQIKSVFNDGTYGLDDPRILFNTEVPSNLLPAVPPHNGAPVRSAADRFVDFAKSIGQKLPGGKLKSDDHKDIREAFRMLSLPYHYAQNFPEYAALLRVQQQREGDSAQRTKKDSDILQGYYGQKAATRKLINDIILAGDTAVETYSDDQLAAWGLDTEEKRAGYHAVREIMDNKLEKQLTWEISALLQKDATIQELLADEEFTEEDLEDFALDAARTIMARNDKFNTVVTDENFEAKVVEALRGVDTITSELVDLADRTRKLVGYIPHTWKAPWRVKAFKPVDGPLLDALKGIQDKFVAALKASGEDGKAADRARSRARNAIKNLTRNFEQAKALRYGDVEKFGPILDAMAANKDVAYVAGQEFIYDVPIGLDTYRLTHQGIKEAANEKAKAVILRNNPGMTNEDFDKAFEAGAFFLIQNREVPVDMFSGAPPGAIESIIEATHRRMLRNYEHYKATGDVTEAELERFKVEAKESVMEMYKAKGWGRHMLERKGVGGYRTDLENVIAEYVTGFNSMESKALAARNFAMALGGIDPTKTPRLWKSAREYVRDMLGDVTPVGTGIKKTLGLWFIAGDASAAALNMAQNFTHGIAVLRQIKGTHISERDMLTAMADVAGQWALDTKMRRDLFKNESRFINQDEIYALRYAYERGTLDPAHFGEFTGLKTSKVYNNVVDTGWRLVYSAFTATESHNRMTMFLAAYRRAVSGGASPREASEKADWAVNEAHMMYGRGNQPEAIRKLGWVGQVGWTFMTFPMSNLSFLGRRAFRATPYINRNVPKSERREAQASLATTLAYTIALGGTASFPLLWLAKLATDWADKDPDEPTYEEKVRMWAEKILHDGASAQFVARALARGLPAAFGVDMSQKVEGTQLTGFTGVQAAGSVYRRIATGADYINRGEILNGIMLASPDMFRSPFAAFALEGGVDRPGYPLIEYTPTQKVVAAMGFPTTESEEERMITRQVETMRKKRNDKLNDLADEMVIAFKKATPQADIDAMLADPEFANEEVRFAFEDMGLPSKVGTALEEYNARREEIGRMPGIEEEELIKRAAQRFVRQTKPYSEARTPKYMQETRQRIAATYDADIGTTPEDVEEEE